MSIQRAPRHLRAIVTAGCAWELLALWTNLPTWTELCARHGWLRAAFKVAAMIHFKKGPLSI